MASKRLNELFSTFLEYDQTQLQLGLWGGDLKIKNVHLKKEAFFPLLNCWKKAGDGVGLESFLSKEVLLNEGASGLPNFDVKLKEGTIGFMRAQVPWKQLIVGAEAPVSIEMKDVTIVLGLESCIFKALNDVDGGLSQLYSKLPKRIHLDRREIDDDDDDTIAPPNISTTRMFVERFVRSFASSLGWRVGRGLYVRLENLRIVMVHGGVEVGILNEKIEIKNCNEGWKTSVDESEQVEQVLKVVNMTKVGIFVRRALKLDPTIRSDPVQQEEFVLDPTDININIGLFRKSPFIKTNLSDPTDTEEIEDEEPQKVRRKKRDRVSTNDEVSTKAGELSSYLSINGDQSIIGSELSTHLSTDHEVSTTTSDLSLHLKTDIQFEKLVFTTSDHNYELLHTFLSEIEMKKNGRPDFSVIWNLDKNPNRAPSDHSKVIKLWWSYAIFNVIRGVRKRRLLAAEFKESIASSCTKKDRHMSIPSSVSRVSTFSSSLTLGVEEISFYISPVGIRTQDEMRVIDLLSFRLNCIKFTFEEEYDKQILMFSIDGAKCMVYDHTLLSSGNVGNFSPLESDSAQYTGQFLSGEIEIVSGNMMSPNQKQQGLDKCTSLSAQISETTITLDYLPMKNVLEFLEKPEVQYFTPIVVPLSVQDKTRLETYSYKNRLERKLGIYKSKQYIQAKIELSQIDLLIPIKPVGSLSSLGYDSKASFILRSEDISVQYSSNITDSEDMFSSRMLLSFQNMDILVRDSTDIYSNCILSFLSNPLNGHIVHSNTVSPNKSQEPNQQTTITTSILALVCSKQRLEYALGLLKTFEIGESTAESCGSSISNYTEPRVLLLADVLKHNIQLTLPEFQLSIERDEENIEEPDSQLLESMILTEIVSNFLSHSACYEEHAYLEKGPGRCAQDIALDRICGLGYSSEIAKSSLEMAYRYFLEELELIKTAIIRRTAEIGNLKDIRAKSLGSYNCDRFSVDSYEETTEDSVESMEILERAIQIAIERMMMTIPKRTIEGGRETAWKRLLTVHLTGMHVSFDQFTYDHKLLVKIGSDVSVRDASGITLLSISSNLGSVLEANGILFFECIEKDCEKEFGLGGESLTILSEDMLMNEAGKRRKREMKMNFSIQNIKSFFCDRVLTKALSEISPIIHLLPFSRSLYEGDKHEDHLPILSHSISCTGDVEDISIICCSDELQPFTNIHFSGMHIDITSTTNNKKAALVTVTSHTLKVTDLSPEGKFYSDVVELTRRDRCQQQTSHKCDVPFKLTFSVAKDSRLCPSELLIIMYNPRLIILRRFINDLIQYFLSTDYGVGKFLSYLSNKGVGTEKSTTGVITYPMNFHINVLEPAIILPSTCESINFVGMDCESLTMSNSYHPESWTTPKVGSKCKGDNRSQGEDTGSDVFNPNNDKSPTTPEFDEAHIFRMNIATEQVNLFTGISSKMIDLNSHDEELTALHNHFDFGCIKEGYPLFVSRSSIPDGVRRKYSTFIHEMNTRKWEKITMNPVQIEILVDFLPTHLRILMKDHVEKYLYDAKPFRIDMRLSQFYTILSTWYGNIQDLPLMFPYSDEEIEKSVVLPEIPVDWPEYGSKSFVDRILSAKTKTCEFAIAIKEIQWSCSFDSFVKDQLDSGFMIGKLPNEKICFHLKDGVVQIDWNEEGVMRLGCGVCHFEILDHRNIHLDFNKSFHTRGEIYSGAIDLEWGLKSGQRLLSEKFDLPLQISIFMTPDNWCLMNVGMMNIDICAQDLACVWILLEYFSRYYLDANFGNPSFAAEENKRNFKRMQKSTPKSHDINKEESCLNIDFRLWMLSPHITIPSDSNRTNKPCLVLRSDNNGIFYRYKTIETDFLSHEICSKNLDIVMSQQYLSPDMNWEIKTTSTSDSDWRVKTLVQSLNFSLNYDTYLKSNHVNIGISIPLLTSKGHQTPDRMGYRNLSESQTLGPRDSESFGIESREIQVQPMLIPPSKVCEPSLRPSRQLGPIQCDLTLSFEYLKMAIDLLNGFVGPYDSLDEQHDGTVDEIPDVETSYSITGAVVGVRILISDPAVGMHLPVACVCIPRLNLTFSQIGTQTSTITGFHESVINSDMQASIDAHLWIDYYKSGPTRSWEPFLEPYLCRILYEKSKRRGKGITYHSQCPFHINVSSALLETLDYTYRSVSDSFFDAFGVSDNSKCHGRETDAKSHITLGPRLVFDNSFSDITHKQTPPLSTEEKVAFSLTNLTGDRIRFHHKSTDVHTFIHYLDHRDAKDLKFPVTMSTIRNLKIVEVPFQSQNNDVSESQVDSSHFVDIQVPGFKWIRDVPVDTTGKRFIDLVPKNEVIQLKMKNDWRLANALKLLTDVSFFDGGRQATVTSPIEIINETSHNIQLAIHPDPMRMSRGKIGKTNLAASENLVLQDRSGDAFSATDSDLEILKPNQVHHIPILLLQSALCIEGSHLGSFWLRPDEKDKRVLRESLQMHEMDSFHDASVDFCSRPIQIAKLVYGSAIMFKESNGSTQGIQLSCPISSARPKFQSPFCYCIEVRRSPLVSPFPGHGEYSHQLDDPTASYETSICDATVPIKEVTGISSLSRANNSKSNATYPMSGLQKEKYKVSNENSVHGPVAYSLVIHPPIIIENLLPEPARYELMHATRQQVVWWGDLKPGESVPVHTVGLDAPLLLMVTTFYCRTPLGEGALVHHGSEKGNSVILSNNKTKNDHKPSNPILLSKNGAKNMALILETDEDRGLHRLAKVKNAATNTLTPTDDFIVNNRTIPSTDKKLGFELTHESIEHSSTNNEAKLHSYTVHNVATETTVVDRLGQRLTLCIGNILGGGGQRKISLYCPYWILNTTEHSLRYKQEKVMSYVSGTVLSKSKDGSRPVDYSNRNSVSYDVRTIFPGRPGALARSSSGKCDITLEDFMTLMNKDIPLERMASLAFMFNYNDTSPLVGNPKLCLQLAESRYTSEWSRGFSLDSVGVSQVIGMHCTDGRLLEVSATISVAPPPLSNFTKIVRFSPRYVIVNQLPKPVRLWQDSSLVHPITVQDGYKDFVERDNEPTTWHELGKGKQSRKISCEYEYLFGGMSLLDHKSGTRMPRGTTAHRSALYITTLAASGDFSSFHLPDTRSDREIRVDFGSSWNLTSSFPADLIGDYTLKLCPTVDLRLLHHVNTRATPQYVIEFPPSSDLQQDMENWDCELGIWFETVNWSGVRKIIVKGTKRGKYSYNNTDIHAGDELVMIDEYHVKRMTFAEAMKLLKDRLSEVRENYLTTKPSGHQKGMKVTFFKRFDRSPSIPSIHHSDTKVLDAETQSNQETLKLTFSTLEYRMKKVRDKSLRQKSFSKVAKTSTMSRQGSNSTTREKHSKKEVKLHSIQRDEDIPVQEVHEEQIRVQMKLLNQSIFMFLRETSSSPQYRIENRSIGHTIQFRQRGCEHYPWNILVPGESSLYAWEEPMKQKKIIIRVGNNCGSTNHQKLISQRKVSPFKVENEDQGGFGVSKVIKLEEIGLRDILPCPMKSYLHGTSNDARDITHLYCHIGTDASTRVLVISDTAKMGDDEELKVLEEHLVTLTKQITEEAKKHEQLKLYDTDLKHDKHEIDGVSEPVVLPTVNENEISRNLTDGRDTQQYVDTPTISSSDIERKITSLADQAKGSAITATNQVMVEVLEASGLNTSSHFSHSSCNPYCVVRLEYRTDNPRQTKIFSREDSDRKKLRRTYYIEKTNQPKWSGMHFVFDIPYEAIPLNRGYTIVVKVKDYRLLGKHKVLGVTEIHLRSLKDQKEVVGWYPLLSRTSRGSELINAASAAGRVRGSIKLRVQWIYSVSSLLQYYILLSENRLNELETNRSGIREQLNKLKRIAKEKLAMTDMLSHASIPSLKTHVRGKHLNSMSSLDLSSLHRQSNNQYGKWALSSSLRQAVKTARLSHMWSRIKEINSSQRQIENALTSNSNVETGKRDKMPQIGEGTDYILERFSEEESKTSSTKASIPIEDITSSFNSSAIISTRQKRFYSHGDVAADEFNHFSPKPIEIDTSKQDFLSERHDQEQRNSSIEFLSEYTHFFYNSSYAFHRKHLSNRIRTKLDISMNKESPKALNEIRSWVLAYELLNDRETRDILGCDVTVEDAFDYFSTSPMSETQKYTRNTIAFPSMILPPSASTFMHERNNAFVTNLNHSRVLFDKAAQRSVHAVVNPGGRLKLRPITVLHLPPGKYTSVYTQVQYGSESCTTRAVDAKVTPTWTHEPDIDTMNEGYRRRNEDFHMPIDIEMNPNGRTRLDRSDFLRDHENDLEVRVQPLKTSGSLRLSVVGVRLQSKMELGVLQIPLANAISCCSESQSNSSQEMYVRWFPLKDPKDCVGYDDVGYITKATDSEQENDDIFSQQYKPCIKLALQWIQDSFEDFKSANEDDEFQSKTGSSSAKPLTEKYFQANIEGLSVALIDSFRAKELLSLSTTDIDLRYSATKSTSRVGFAVGSIQVDHHDESAMEPVILSPTPVLNPQPTIQMITVKDNLKSNSNIDSYIHVAFALEEMDFRLEEIWIFDLWEFFSRLMRRHQAMQKSLLRSIAGRGTDESFSEEINISKCFADVDPIDDKEIKDAFDDNDVDNQATHLGEKQIYIEQLMLGFVKINISYIKSVNRPLLKHTNNQSSEDGSSRIDTRETQIFRQWSELGYDEDWSGGRDTHKNIANIISAVFPAISDVSVKVQGKRIDNVFETWSEIYQSLKNYYVSSTMIQIYKLIGSLEVAGNPIIVLNFFMKGAKDFVLPFREFFRSPNNPSRFARGFARGTLSLFSNFFSGIFRFVSNVLDFGGKAAASLSMDTQFVRWHSQQIADHTRHKSGHQFRPRGMKVVFSTLSRPLEDILLGVYFAAKGIFVEPYRGARISGRLGFAKGLAIGVVGTVVKPTVGVFDAFYHLSSSMQDVARSINILDKKQEPVKKKRLPYIFGLSNILLPFNPVDARSSNLLKLYSLDSNNRNVNFTSEKSGECWEEVLVLSEVIQMEPEHATYVIITNLRIASFLVKTDGKELPTLRWYVLFEKDVSITSHIDDRGHNGVVVYISCHHNQDTPKKTDKSMVYDNIPENNLGCSESIFIRNASSDSSFYDTTLSKDRSLLQRSSDKREKKTISKHASVFLPHFHGQRFFTGDAYFQIFGEFQHKPELTRIHNAICCLSKRFDQLICDGIGGYTSGYTSFGIYTFDSNDVSKDSPKEEKDNFYRQMENAPWCHNIHESNNCDRRDWLFADELKSSKMYGGSEWIINARASAMFTPMLLPQSYPYINYNDAKIVELADNLKKGSISYNEAEERFQSFADSAKRPSDNCVPSLKAPCINTDETSANTQMMELKSNNGTIEPFLHQRLSNVEFALQQLLHNQSNTDRHTTDHDYISSIGRVQQQLPIDHQHQTHNYLSSIQRESIDNSNTSIISALSYGYGNVSDILNQNNRQQQEAERLRQEVKELKKQLNSVRATESSKKDTRSKKRTQWLRPRKKDI